MNHDLPPHELSQAALESELQNQLRPRALRAGLREEILDALESPHTLSPADRQLQDTLLTLRPAQAPAALWDRLAAQLDSAPSSPSKTPPPSVESEKISAFPQWREMAPLFKVAAAIAIGAFLASVWWQPADTPSPSTALQPTAPSQASPRLADPTHVVPIGRRGFIQGMESQGILEKDNQIYEQYWQTRKDRSLYRLDGNVRVEDEVSREGPVITPLRTF